MIGTPDLSLAALEALGAEVIRLRADNEQLRQRIEALSEANNAARAALEDEHDQNHRLATPDPAGRSGI